MGICRCFFVELFVLYLAFTFCLGRKTVNSTCVSPESCVFEEIFAGYNRLTRPVSDFNTVVNVHVQMVVNGLLDIEEKEEFMKIVGFFRLYWKDDLLTWDPLDHSNVTELVVPADKIWVPDIGITNSVSSFYEITYRRDFHLKILYTGQIRWSFGGILTTSCDIDLSFYPFDEQHCSIELESWQFDLHKVQLYPLADTPVNLDTTDDDPQWILRNATGDRYLKYEGTYSTVRFTLHWLRKPLYFYVNIIVPCLYMAVITLGVFWLPSECGEKMSLAITVVLAFSVFQIVIMDITPVSSDAVPKITELVVTVMSLATASLLSSMFVSYLSDNDTPPPMWAKKVFLYHIPRILRMSSYKLYKEELYTEASVTEHNKKHVNEREVYMMHFMDESGSRPDSPKSVKQFMEKGNEVNQNGQTVKTEPSKKHEVLVKDVRDILHRLHYMKDKIVETEENKKIKEDWKNIGRAVDRIMFWVCFIVLMAYIIYACVKISSARMHHGQ